MSRKAFRKFAKEHMNSENSEFPKDRLIEIPRSEWPPDTKALQDPKRMKVFRNRNYLVQLFQENGGVIRISVTKSQLGMGRTFADGLSWDELQDIKRMAGYGDCFAVEIYPRGKDIVNVANMRHLWVLPQPLDFGWVKHD